MEPRELMECLLELAAELGIEVRMVRTSARGEGEFTPVSSFCRIRGKGCVMLSAQDPVGFQNRALAVALTSEAGTLLEERYLPPAVRRALDEVEAPELTAG